VDKRADVWAFGIVLYEMLTGRQAFSGETVSDVIAGVLTREIDWTALPDDTPPAVRHLLRRCLERDPRKRLRDIGDALYELEDGSSHSASGSGAVSGAIPSLGGGSGRTALLVAGAALAAAAATVVVMLPGTAPAPVGPMVFSLPAPPGTRLDQVVISPDGRSLVFAAESSSGVSHLWLRKLDGRDLRRLDGTDGGRDPFWSPDSRFLGFFTEAQLLRIEIETGVTQTLAAVSNTRGGAWNRDDTIVVGGENLLRIPADGGGVTTALAIDTASGENAIRYPSFLPDGKHVLFYSRNAKDRALAGLWTGSIDTGARQHLTAAASSAAVYVEPGYLLYRRDRYLIAHAFDPASLTFTGDPTPIADDVWYEPGVTALTSVSASENRTVTFRSGGPETTDLAWFDRQGRRIGTEWEPKSFVTVALSADGTRILTGFPGQAIERNAWLYDIPTATARQITSTGDNAGSHVFSDDGARAIIGIITDAKLGMWLARLGSGAVPEFLPTERDVSVPTDWHGALVIHEGADLASATTRSLYALDLDTRTNRLLVDRPGNEGFGVISPDGRWLAYSSNETGEWETYVETFPEAGGRWRVSADGGHQPRWNPKGSELFYIAPNRQLMAAQVRGGSSTFQWDSPRPLFQTDIVDLGPYRGSWGYAVAPDGDRFLILTRRPQGPTPAVAILSWR
jgi:Tol biopolymer transport system component